MLDPATGVVVGTAADATPADVSQSVDAAARTLPSWRAVPAIERARPLALRGGATAIGKGRSRGDHHGRTREAPPRGGRRSGVCRRLLRLVRRRSRAGLRPGRAGSAGGQAADRASTASGCGRGDPPWNFPAAMLTRKLGPALAAGCTTVVKPAEATPLTAMAICRAIAEAGAPPGVVNLVTSSRPAMVAERFFADRRLRKVSFTGPPRSGNC